MYFHTRLAWPDPLPRRAFIAYSIRARAPEGLLEFTDLTSSKTANFRDFYQTLQSTGAYTASEKRHARKRVWLCETTPTLHNEIIVGSVIYKLSDIGSHKKLSIEQTRCVFKQTCSFARNVIIRKNLANKEKTTTSLHAHACRYTKNGFANDRFIEDLELWFKYN